jgi:hypothetical protein
MSAILKITDGTTEVSLINGPIYLSEWLPTIPGYKGGGVFADSPVGESRHLVYRQLESVTESMSIKIANFTQDDTIRSLRKLVNLLESAANYWANPYASTPVYLVAKASMETETRYGHIIVGRVPNMGQIMAQPFTNCSTPVLDNMSLIIEHHPWTASIPGSTGTAVSIGVSEPNHNVIGNSSFESDSIKPPIWADTGGPSTSEARTTRAYRGNRSHYVVATGASEGIQQTLDGIEQDATYTFSAWVYVESGTVAVELSTDGTFANLASSTSTTTGEWEQLSVSQTLVAASQVSVRSSGGAATFYVDQAELFIQGGYVSSTISDGSVQFIGNGQAQHAINYIYTYDNSTWSDNQLYESSPESILGRNNDEATYFGVTGGLDDFSASILANGGPFNNLVFNISSAIAGSGTFAYQYYNGASWSTFTPVDKTSGFSETGSNLVSWEWAGAWEPGALDSIISVGEGSASAPTDEAFWIRIIKTGGTMSGAQRPAIATPFPYTITWPYIDLGTSANPIGGDFNARGRISITNEGGSTDVSSTYSVPGSTSDTYFETTIDSNENTAVTLKVGEDYSSGIRFTGVSIAEGDQILSARIKLIATAADGAASTTARLKIVGHDVTNSGELDGYNLATWQGLPRTTAEVSWYIIGVTAAGNVHYTPDFSNVLQELVDDGSVGNMTFFIEDDGTSDAGTEYNFASLDNVTYDEPILEIVYQDASNGVWINRVIAATRSTSRGSNFISHINMSDVQVQPGIRVIPQNKSYFESQFIRHYGGQVVIIDSSLGESMPWPVPVPYVPPEDSEYNVIVEIDSVLAQEYVGEFRAFLRVSGDLQSGETSEFSIAVRVGSSGITKFGSTSAEFRFVPPGSGARSSFQGLLPVDLGIIRIPANSVGTYDNVKLLISGAASVTDRKLRLHDLILMPADEWIGEVYTDTGSQKAVVGDEIIVFDSVSDNRRPISAFHLAEDGEVKALLTPFSRQLVLSRDEQQRIYFLFYTTDREDSTTQFGDRSVPYSFAEIAVTAEKKFLSARGDE